MESRAVWEGPSLVIDTDSYAGNFERPLCTYVTGIIDEQRASFECPEMARLYQEEVGAENPLDGLVAWGLEFDDDVPSVTVCSIYPTLGWSNDGHGEHYQVTNERPYKHPAYYSVRLFLHREPTEDELSLIKARAKAFATRGLKYQPPFTITGYRLVYERVIVDGRAV